MGLCLCTTYYGPVLSYLRPQAFEEEGGGERRPGIHCMCMCNDFCIIYRKSVCTPILTTCWQVKRSICIKNTGWPPDLCTSARTKCAPSYLKISLKTWSVQTVISRCIEHEELRSMGRYTRQYPYIIWLFKIYIITVHAHAVDTRPSLLPTLEGLGTRLVLSLTRALRAYSYPTHVLHLHYRATWTHAVDDLYLHVWGQASCVHEQKAHA